MLGLPRPPQEGGSAIGGPPGAGTATSSVVQAFLNNVVMVTTHGQKTTGEIRSSIAGQSSAQLFFSRLLYSDR